MRVESGLASDLDRYGRAAREAALDYIHEQPASAHLTGPAADYLKRGGKNLRPALCLATCGAFGGRLEDALPSAAAMELFHTAFLVHDDVEDDSARRRGAPTLHRRYGTALAVNAGDGLAVFALGALRNNQAVLGGRLAARIWAEFEFMARQTVDGQAIELGWQSDGWVDITPDDYLDLVMKKTCWYTTVLPLRVGALIGCRAPVDLEPLLRFGYFLGAAFQIRDDILNLTGSPDVTGKEPLGDLREGKRTLMLIHLLAAAPPAQREFLADYLTTPPSGRSRQGAEEVLGMMRELGSISFAESFAAGIARSAEVAYEEAFGQLPDSSHRRFLRDLIPYMIERDH